MIKIICVGKIKEKYFNDLINDYYTRINKYHKMIITEVRDTNDLKTEAKEIEKYISNRDFIITLEISGNKLDSYDFSKKLDLWLMENSNIVFIIGGSYGIADEIKNKSNYRLSFSDLTFPHGLFRGLLLEQIYRCFKINNNETYHK